MFVCYRYRLLPRKAQHRALEAILESQRQLYNAALEERIAAYRKVGKTITYCDQSNELTEWRRIDPEARELPRRLQLTTLKRIDRAYQRFFERHRTGENPGFPRFQGRARFRSFGFGEFAGITLKRGRLRFNGMPGALRVHWHRPLPPSTFIKSCTFRRDTKGWVVSFDVAAQVKGVRTPDRVVGVDLGIARFATLSDGGFIPSLSAARRAERQLRIAQRAAARKVRGSASRAKARLALARLYAKVGRRRREHLHQASARLIRDYDVIAVEALDVAKLANSVLGKEVRDASWAKFISFLRYKAEWAGAWLVEVDPYNTSQECSCCGVKVQKGLAVRWHDCPNCGLSLDRDLNAARNILNRAGVGPGLRNVAGWSGKRAGGNLVSETAPGRRWPTSHYPLLFGSKPPRVAQLDGASYHVG